MRHIYKYTKYPETIPKDTRTLYGKLNEKRNERRRYKINMNIQRYNKEIGKKHSYKRHNRIQQTRRKNKIKHLTTYIYKNNKNRQIIQQVNKKNHKGCCN